MSNRERWIIYPLLFFAMALAIKAQVRQSGSLEVTEVTCRQLSVTDSEGRVRLKLLADEQGGLALVMDGQGSTVVALSSLPDGGGQLQVSGPELPGAVVVTGQSSGGSVRTAGSSGQPVLVLGYDPAAPYPGLSALVDQPALAAGDESPADGRSWGLALPEALSSLESNSDHREPQRATSE